MSGRTVAVLVACLVLAACGDDPSGDAKATTAPTTTTAATPSEPASPTAEPGTEIVVAGSAFGPMLFDTRKQAIYLFDIETTDEPKCYGDCAEAWPPVLTDGEPAAGDSVQR